MNGILTVEHLNVTIDGTPILNDIGFTVEKGENLVIIGPNGSGKTVLLKTLLGIQPYTGTLQWAQGTKIGYVPQKVDADRHLPITFENIYRAKASFLHIGTDEITEATERVGLSKQLLNTPVGHLSGGQFQKALLAFALLGKPNVILLDEPTASLDQLSQDRVYELIHELQDAYGITMILVSHDLSIVYHYATSVLCINREKICHGTPQEAMRPEVLDKLYGAPHKYFHHIHGDH